MPTRYLLDTSAMLAHYRQETGWETVHGLFEDPEAEIEIASPTLTEFARRLHTLGIEEDLIKEKVDDYTLLFSRIIAIDASIAASAWSLIRQSPARLPLIDALIAAAAQASEATLVHRDTHMASIPPTIVHQHFLSAPTRTHRGNGAPADED